MSVFRRILIVGGCLLLPWTSSRAQIDASSEEGSSAIETYVARLSAQDHFNSNGERLRSPAAIVRQDRANFYVYGRRDPEDEPDRFFSSKENRARLERLLEGGRTPPEARRVIVNGTPLIRVEVYRDFVNVTILSE